MDIPTGVALTINPTMDALYNSVVYTFNDNDKLFTNNGDIMYKFPYSKGTWWTNFKYSVYPISNQQLIISVVLITNEGYTYVISRESFIQQNEWNDTIWPLLSLNTSGNNYNNYNNYNINNKSGLYFKIKPLKGDENIHISIKLVGFRNLFPKSENYILISPVKTYQFVFTEFENEDGTTDGTMYNVEHVDYIRDIINKSFLVYMLADY
jgi:hypothetical protein